MATVTGSAGILVVLIIASLSISVQSFPDGCTKLTGSPEDGKPGEFFVKVYSTVRSETIVKIMLELSTSGCEGKLWRSSNTSNALMAPITCSDMSYMEGFGFFAKMSDAAVIWVCENDAVDYIQPNFRLILPPIDEPDPDTTQSPYTEDGSGVALTSGSIVTIDIDNPEGSGMGTVLPTTITPPSTKCKKIKEYKDDREMINNRFIVTMYRDTSVSFIQSFVEDLKVQSNRPGSTMSIKSIQPLSFVKMIIAEMNMKAMEHVCENPKVKSIEFEVVFTLSPPTSETSAITTTTPKTTTAIVTTTATATTAIPITEISTPSSRTLQCNKLRGGKIRSNRLNLCRIYMKKTSTKSDCRRFVRKLKAMDNDVKSDIRFEFKQVGHDRQRPMITAKLNQQAVDMVCRSTKTEMIIRI